MKTLQECFRESKYSALKWEHYFEIYESLLSEYRGKQPLIVEVGVLNGGSLEMWARYFGRGALIVGIDVRVPNIDVDEWNASLRSDGHGSIQIIQGNAESNQFWKEFFGRFNDVDVFIDDGGHSNLQQIVAVSNAIRFVGPCGLIICEDTHTSFDWRFGNPHKYSFQNYVHHIADLQTRRLSRPSRHSRKEDLLTPIKSLKFYPGIIAIEKAEQRADDFTVIDNSGIVAQPTAGTAPSIQFGFIAAARVAELVLRLEGNRFGRIGIIPLQILLSIQRWIANFTLRSLFMNRRTH